MKYTATSAVLCRRKPTVVPSNIVLLQQACSGVATFSKLTSCMALLFVLFAPLIASAQLDLVGDDFQISTTGGAAPEIVYNATGSEYLVAWRGLSSDISTIYGQRLDADANTVGDSFAISMARSDGENQFGADFHDVALNSIGNEYLVTWQGNAIFGKAEIFGQRLDGSGNALGDNFQISMTGPADDITFDAFFPAIAFNSTGNEYLVTWQQAVFSPRSRDIYGQCLDSSGNTLGDSFRIGMQEGSSLPDVAYNPMGDEYLVTWSGETADGDFEVFGQRLDGNGIPLGDNFHVSSQGPDGDTDIFARASEVTYNQTSDEYVVTWQGGPIFAGREPKNEIYGQRLDASGNLLDGNFQISMAAENDADVRDGSSTTHNAGSNEYLVTWLGESTSDENGIYGQRLDGDGSPLGQNFEIKLPGFVRPAAAFNSTGDEYLVTWTGQSMTGDAEIFGQRLRQPLCTPLNGLLGDLDGDGTVAFEDFLTLSANFGTDISGVAGNKYTLGDIDCSGDVAFDDFLILSANFGQTIDDMSIQNVPEPTFGMLHAVFILQLLNLRRFRRVGEIH